MERPSEERQWGRWTLNLETLCVETPLGSGPIARYEIAIDLVARSSEILAEIYKLASKTWVTSEDLGDFVRAMADIFGDVEAINGVEREIDAKALLARKYGGVRD